MRTFKLILSLRSPNVFKSYYMASQGLVQKIVQQRATPVTIEMAFFSFLIVVPCVDTVQVRIVRQSILIRCVLI